MLFVRDQEYCCEKTLKMKVEIRKFHSGKRLNLDKSNDFYSNISNIIIINNPFWKKLFIQKNSNFYSPKLTYIYWSKFLREKLFEKLKGKFFRKIDRLMIKIHRPSSSTLGSLQSRGSSRNSVQVSRESRSSGTISFT